MARGDLVKRACPRCGAPDAFQADDAGVRFVCAGPDSHEFLGGGAAQVRGSAGIQSSPAQGGAMPYDPNSKTFRQRISGAFGRFSRDVISRTPVGGLRANAGGATGGGGASGPTPVWYCRNCGTGPVGIDKDACPSCGAPRPGKRFYSPQVLSALLVLAAGYFATTFINAGGIPWFMMAAATYAFHILIPKKTPEIAISAAVFRAVSLILLTIGVMDLRSLNFFKLIAFVVFVIGYSTFPKNIVSFSGDPGQTAYSTSLVGMRFLLGLALGIFFMVVFFGQTGNRFPMLTAAFGLLCAAFYVTIPSPGSSSKPPEGADANTKAMFQAIMGAGEILSKDILMGLMGKKTQAGLLIAGIVVMGLGALFMSLKLSWGFIVVLLGFVLMLISLLSSLNTFTLMGMTGLILGAWSIFQSNNEFAMMMFSIVVGVGVFAGMPKDAAEARPFIGIPVLLFGLVMSSLAYPSVLGEAIFGPWWPTIQNSYLQMTASFAPNFSGMSQFFGTMSKGMNCLTSPATCYQEDTVTDAKSQKGAGTLRITDFRPLTDARISSPPSENNVYNLTVSLRLTNGAKETPIGGLKVMAGVANLLMESEGHPEGIPIDHNITIEGDCAQAIENGTTVCVYPDGDYMTPEESRNHIIIYHIKGKIPPGQYVTYTANVSYTFNASAALDIEVMNEQYMRQLAKDKPIVYRKVSSSYTGGPVEVAISTNEQPIKGGSTTPLILSVENRAEGEVKAIANAKLIVPSAFGNFGNNTTGNYIVDLTNELDKQLNIPKSSDSTLPPLATRVVKTKNPAENTRTFGLNAEVSYTYLISRKGTIQVLYQCAADSDCRGRACPDSEIPECNEDVGMCGCPGSSSLVPVTTP